MRKAIFLFDRTGLAAKPWLDAGYECWLFDGQHSPGITREGLLVKVGMWFEAMRVSEHVAEMLSMVGEGVEMVMGFPECTYLTNAGALWYYHPDDKHLPPEKRRPHPRYPDRVSKREEAVELAKMVEKVGLAFSCKWCAENPTGSLSRLWRAPDFSFDPCDYGLYLAEDDAHPLYPEVYPPRDAYNKKTWIWCGGGFVIPVKLPLAPERHANPGWERCGGKSVRTKNIRSATPRGFPIAVYEANKCS